MSKFTKTESTQAIWDILSEETYDSEDQYTMAIEPEVYTDEDETFIYLNLVVIERNTQDIYSRVDGASVELGRYDDDDDETVDKAYDKVIKEAKQFDIYVTDPA